MDSCIQTSSSWECFFPSFIKINKTKCEPSCSISSQWNSGFEKHRQMFIYIRFSFPFKQYILLLFMLLFSSVQSWGLVFRFFFHISFSLLVKFFIWIGSVLKCFLSNSLKLKEKICQCVCECDFNFFFLIHWFNTKIKPYHVCYIFIYLK